MSLKAEHIRSHVIRRSLFEPTSLAAAMDAMGFVQADPIRSPARAQDLILRHRVTGYRAGDLEHEYPRLDIDEDVVYAYGFVSSSTRRLLHPRGGEVISHGLPRDVLDFVRRSGPTHPRELLHEFGNRRERNAWGGHSRATTRVLELLHYRGQLRVARREAGIRVYEAARQLPESAPGSLTSDERLCQLALLLARLFAPLPEASLRTVMAHLRHAAPALEGRRTIVSRLLQAGELERGNVDGLPYIWPAGAVTNGVAEVPRTVRFLAPFDPVVWDRRRFEHLWGWAYRFEAYTPVARRQFGYYALPLLWADRVIGWANITMRKKGGRPEVALGFVTKRPRDRAFTRALNDEIDRVHEFLDA